MNCFLIHGFNKYSIVVFRRISQSSAHGIAVSGVISVFRIAGSVLLKSGWWCDDRFKHSHVDKHICVCFVSRSRDPCTGVVTKSRPAYLLEELHLWWQSFWIHRWYSTSPQCRSIEPGILKLFLWTVKKTYKLSTASTRGTLNYFCREGRPSGILVSIK